MTRVTKAVMSAQKSVTSYTVARLAGVSRTTVSLVLNNAPHARISEETRRRVMEAATQLDYRPHAGARQLARGRSDIIAFVLRQTPDQVFADAFLPEMLGGLARALTKASLHLLYFPLPPTSPSVDCLKLLRERRVEGLILSGPRFEDLEWVERWMEEAPVVLLGHIPNSHAPSVDVDNVQAAAMATRHLIHLGHRRIGLITNAPLTYTAIMIDGSGIVKLWRRRGYRTMKRWSCAATSPRPLMQQL